MPEYSLGSCPDPYKDGWHVVFELEDDENVDDVPNTNEAIWNAGQGFKTDSAYFLGVDEINALGAYSRAQLCAGYRANTDGCPRVKCFELTQEMLHSGGYDSNGYINS